MRTRILSPRIVQLSSISALSEAPAAPASKLLDPQPGHPWIAPDPDLAVFTLDHGTALAQLELDGYDTLFLGYAVRAETGEDGTAQVDLAATLGGLASPTYSSGALPFRMTPDIDPTWRFVHWWHVFPSIRTERFARVTLSFPGAAAVHLSIVVLDRAYVPQTALAPGFGVTPIEEPIVTRAISGATWVQGRPQRRKGPLVIQATGPTAPTAIQGELGRLYREVGQHTPVVLILDDAPTSFAMDKVLYGNLVQTTPTPLAMPGFGLWTVGYDIEEWR